MFQGSRICGDCEEGYIGNQTVGCRRQPGLCRDGQTICDGNARCVTGRGFTGYMCQVSVVMGRNWINKWKCMPHLYILVLLSLTTQSQTVHTPPRRPTRRPIKYMRRDGPHEARRKCNSFEKDRVAYRARLRRHAACCANDGIVCLKNWRDVSRAIALVCFTY